MSFAASAANIGCLWLALRLLSSRQPHSLFQGMRQNLRLRELDPVALC